ncbi:hypothetical protein [Paraburkholderia humisilvae]|uniref:Uncharacterized protein n=1 Tax=Paraburkholderia humisilvae TaxID=627669 RepID=A0A6J5DHU8_9BURK|nr:hypothetical protein [Paraburkholderia humisilvae]CAB3752416.1 hypothetical protein LMG29542_01738 [Paraburkholderia humisilvae]
MSRLTDNIGNFQTGDLVFTRYPPDPKSKQPCHVTLFLDDPDRYVHAGAVKLEIADASTYATDAGVRGYLHAHPTDERLRLRAAEVAQTFARTLTPTPYGDYPSTKLIEKLNPKLKLPEGGPQASRFQGMIRYDNFGGIPFEFASLLRVLKWTSRAIKGNVALSENRGFTCAAFISICHQVARMLIFFDEARTSPETIHECALKLGGYAVPKAELRRNLQVIAEHPKTHKPIYQGHALRENSNRPLLDSRKEELDSKAASFYEDDWQSYDIKYEPSSEFEWHWVIIQRDWLKIHPAKMKSLQAIFGEFLFDAKYVNSRILPGVVLTGGWEATEYTAY